VIVGMEGVAVVPAIAIGTILTQEAVDVAGLVRVLREGGIAGQGQGLDRDLVPVLQKEDTAGRGLVLPPRGDPVPGPPPPREIRVAGLLVQQRLVALHRRLLPIVVLRP